MQAPNEHLPAFTLRAFLFFFFSFWPCMWKFPGQGSNLSHSSDPNHSSDNARSLTHYPTRELPLKAFFYSSFIFWLRGIQGSDSSCSLDLSHSYGTARSLTHCGRSGMEPASQCSQDTTNPVVLQWELLEGILKLKHFQPLLCP